MRHLVKHARSLILMQMVDRNLRRTICSDDRLWRRVFKDQIYKASHLSQPVKQTRYPGLRLFKSSLTSVPVHMGPIRGDRDDHTLPAGFDEAFAAYVRKAFALQNGHRCGMCGSRWHHDPYWSLGMRVCRLCVAGNVVSNWELLDKYGLHFYDILRQIAGKVFYFAQACAPKHDKLPPFSVRPVDLAFRQQIWCFWRPHLAQCFDLPALYAEQQRRRAAVQLLSGLCVD